MRLRKWNVFQISFLRHFWMRTKVKRIKEKGGKKFIVDKSKAGKEFGQLSIRDRKQSIIWYLSPQPLIFSSSNYLQQEQQSIIEKLFFLLSVLPGKSFTTYTKFSSWPSTLVRAIMSNCCIGGFKRVGRCKMGPFA